MKLEYTPAEFVSELDRQGAQAQALATGLSDAALNWRPNGGKGWSVAQCLDHLRNHERKVRQGASGCGGQ